MSNTVTRPIIQTNHGVSYPIVGLGRCKQDEIFDAANEDPLDGSARSERDDANENPAAQMSKKRSS